MYTDILKETKIIVIILRAAPVVTVARITIITAWDIFRSIAMVMAVPILTSIGMKTTMIAAVAMTMQPRSITTIMKSTRTMNAAVVMSMKSMSTMSVAVVMSIIMSIMYLVTPMTANASFAILTKSIVMFVAKA